MDAYARLVRLSANLRSCTADIQHVQEKIGEGKSEIPCQASTRR